MSFELYISNNLRRQKQLKSFIPFSDDCKLPSCTTTVYEAKMDEAMYESKGVRYEDYSGVNTQLVDPDRQYYITPYEEGIIIQSKKDPDGVIYVHDNYQRIDAIADTKHASAAMLYDTLLGAYQFVAVNAGALMMHSAAVDYNGEAILFCGISGAGKSTQSSLWVEHYDAKPINYDHPCIIWEGDTPIAYGSPWGGKEKFCEPVGAPIKAIVFVNKSEQNAVRQMSKGEAYAYLNLNNALPHVRPEMDAKLNATVLKLVEQVPVFSQECTKSIEAPEALHRVLYGE